MNCEVTEMECNSLINTNQIGIVFLPTNENYEFKGAPQILYPSATVSVMKLLIAAGIPSEISKGNIEEVVFSDNHSIDWFGPLILFTSAAITQNPALVSITLNLISSYVYDIFKGKSNDPNIRCTFFYSDSKKGKRIEYDGPVSGLNQVNDILTKVYIK